MNTKKRLFVSALLIGLAAAGVLISGSHNVAKAGPGASPVSIVSPLPLPTTGTATVSGTVGATQSGAWNVGISGTPTVGLAPGSGVNVNNPLDALGNPVPLAASDVDGPARRPFQGFVCATTTSNFGEGQCQSAPGFVPSGKLLVIEYVNGGCSVPLGKSLTQFVVIAAGGPGIASIIAPQTPTLIGSDGFSNLYSVNQLTRIYGTPSLDIASTDLTGNTRCSLWVSGYLE